MEKCIDLGYYDQYYSGDELDCISQPIAALADFAASGNYFFYAFYSILFSGWNVCEGWESYGFLERKNYILSKLGLELCKEIIVSPSVFLKTVKSQIDHANPVLLLLRRITLVYDKGDIDSTHGVVISGYNDECKRVLLRDAPHVEQSGAKYAGGGYGLFNLWLREDLLSEMWSQSNQIHTAEFHSCLFTISQKKERGIHSYYELLSDFIRHYGFRKNNLAAFLRSVDLDLSKFMDDEYCRDFRSWMILPKKVICDIIIRAAKEMHAANVDELIVFAQQITRNYAIIANKLTRIAFRKTQVSKETIWDIASLIENMDAKMQFFIEKLLAEYPDS